MSYLEELPIGKRVSVRSISNHLGVSDGTAYRAIKEAENRGIVETRPRSGTIRVKSQKVAIERLTYAEIAEVTSSEVLAGQEGLEREFSKFSIGAMTEQNILSYLHDGGLLIVGDRTRIQLLALENENAVLVTGGFHVQDDVLELANKKGIPVLRSKHDTFTVATMINKALSNVQIKTDILTVEKLYRPSHEYGFLRETDTVKDYLDLVRKNRSSRFPVINQHQVVVGVVTMRDAGDKSPSITLGVFFHLLNIVEVEFRYIKVGFGNRTSQYHINLEQIAIFQDVMTWKSVSYFVVERATSGIGVIHDCTIYSNL